jgi:hypothetical protein
MVAGDFAGQAVAPGSGPSRSSRAIEELKLWGGSLAFASAIGWILGIIWWGVLSPDARQAVVDELIIPPGTAAAIERGTGIAFVPGQVSLSPGSRLLVINNDSVQHTIGEYVIPPGATAELSFDEESETFACTIHPSGFLGVNLRERPHFATTLVPAAFIGIPSGLTIGAGIWIGRRLKVEEEETTEAS